MSHDEHWKCYDCGLEHDSDADLETCEDGRDRCNECYKAYLAENDNLKREHHQKREHTVGDFWSSM